MFFCTAGLLMGMEGGGMTFKNRAGSTGVVKCLLVTGGYGFVGGTFIRWVLANTNVRVVNIDSLTYAAQPEALYQVAGDQRHSFFHCDINSVGRIVELLEHYKPDALINFAAESHVDRSIIGPADFVNTNIQGTFSLLRACQNWLQQCKGPKDFRFLQVSTDEVYGDLGKEGRSSKEGDPWHPSSPYAASKAAADHLVDSWVRTYGFPALVSHSSNNYGPWQYPEKLIPKVIDCALAGKPIPLYGCGEQVRDWMHVEDHVRALWYLLQRGQPGEHYNIGADSPKSNIELVMAICALLDELSPSTQPPGGHASLIRHVEDRPGHDWRYALDTKKISLLGWQSEVLFEQGLRDTVAFYLHK